ncbi:MAG: enoyl-CoA hydratase/isomerase family protein [Paracoccaceae bacterium]|nr:enoyl-CoA hydratase/isomerase family protein [Paracoccaceae bacterium]MDE2913387.1 enoyl-CoA hydratase/isomerase family protein [Paracoccaceae bacterium]
MPDYSQIRTSVTGGAGVLRLFRPEARNALTDTMLSEAREALQSWEADRAITSMILTGDDSAFCAGGDLKGTASRAMPPFETYRHRHTAAVWHGFVRFLGRCTKPVIAAVEGHALGGGLEIALRCDFAVGSETAQVGLTEARIGLFPILGGAWSLARTVGSRKARELAYTGRRIGADEALALGIFNHVTPPGRALDKAVEIADEISMCGPLAVMAIKQAINRAHEQSFDQALAAGGDLSALLMFSEDRNEGLKAFLEKRDPEFRGE